MRITDPFGDTMDYVVRDGKIMMLRADGEWVVSAHDGATVDEIPSYALGLLPGYREIATLLREKYGIVEATA